MTLPGKIAKGTIVCIQCATVCIWGRVGYLLGTIGALFTPPLKGGNKTIDPSVFLLHLRAI